MRHPRARNSNISKASSTETPSWLHFLSCAPARRRRPPILREQRAQGIDSKCAPSSGIQALCPCRMYFICALFSLRSWRMVITTASRVTFGSFVRRGKSRYGHRTLTSAAPSRDNHRRRRHRVDVSRRGNDTTVCGLPAIRLPSSILFYRRAARARYR